MGLFDQLRAEAKKVADQLSEKAAAKGIDVEKLKGQAAQLGHRAGELRQRATDQVNAYARTAQQPREVPAAAAPAATDATSPAGAGAPPPREAVEGLDIAALKAKGQQLLGQAKDRAVEAREVMLEKTDAAAAAVAAKVSEKTGRDVTPSQVKKVALAAGIALAAAGAIDLLADAMAEGAGGEFAGSGEAASASVGSGDASVGSGDVMDEAGDFFARNGGSLNIEHVTVDIDGCEI